MKKLLAILLCFVFVCSFAACDNWSIHNASESTQDSTEAPSTEEELPYSFISMQERLSWKDKIVTVMSNNDLYDDYEVLRHNFFGMALMDINFDGTPELIAVYAGGSMGNVFLISYDLESGEETCIFSSTPHYLDSNNIFHCVHRDNEGNYIMAFEGSLRAGLESYFMVGELNDELIYDCMFEVVISNGNNRYLCGENEVDKTEYEKQVDQFRSGYIEETQIKIVYWDSIDGKDKSEMLSLMADALINSEQQFIDFKK